MIKRIPDGSAPTMESVAKLAGVSKITVSRALRDSELVRPELRERIREVARTVGYRLNLAARNLRNRRTQTIAVVLENLSVPGRPVADPLVLLLIGGMLEELTSMGYALLLTNSEQFLKSDALIADGVIMLGEGEGGLRARQVADLGIPIVVWGAPLAGGRISVVGSDNREGGRLAAGHLVHQGCRRILFLGDVRHPEVAARHEGVRDILSTTAANLVAALSCEFTRKGGADAVASALDDGHVFDGVIASSDYIAAGACGLLLDRGLAVPGDVAVIGYDDNPLAASHRPPLSSIRQDWDDAGRQLSRTVLRIIEDPAAAAFDQMLPVQLVVRETSLHAAGEPPQRKRARKNSATRS
jgi:DNA-binding LacI/PurR family transcriptional regulator